MKYFGCLLLFLLVPAFSSAKNNCCVFPTMERPQSSYLEDPRRFGSPRENGRLHAGCDIYQSFEGQPVTAVEDGRILRQLYAFYQGTYALEVKHKSGFVVRYGEVTGKMPNGTTTGSKVKRGAVIAYNGKVNSGCCEPMLHFERYRGNRLGALTQRDRPPYQRRQDLIDPTQGLQAWEKLSFPPLAPGPLFDTSRLERGIPSFLSAESASFQTLLKAIAKFYQSHQPLKLYDFLNQRKFQAVMTIDGNSETGRMTVVETRNESFSAHHLRAQYFRDEKGRDFIQHISFVLRPGVKTMAETIQALVKQVPFSEPPQWTTADFIQWDLGEGYVLWLKEMAEADLVNNPFHNYTEQDIGSLKIAIELTPEH